VSEEKEDRPDLAVVKPTSDGLPSPRPADDEALEARIERVVEERVFQIIASFHQGPLPTPQDLQQYEVALQGTANRVVRMAEIEQENRHLADRRDTDNQAKFDLRSLEIYSRNSLFGLVAATVIVVGTIGGGIWLIYLNKQIAGLSAIVVALVGLVGAFIGGRYLTARERAPELPSGSARKPRPTPTPHTHADVGASGAVRRRE
jgi:uncharacterized membrane protein